MNAKMICDVPVKHPYNIALGPSLIRSANLTRIPMAAKAIISNWELTIFADVEMMAGKIPVLLIILKIKNPITNHGTFAFTFADIPSFLANSD